MIVEYRECFPACETVQADYCRSLDCSSNAANVMIHRWLLCHAKARVRDGHDGKRFGCLQAAAEKEQGKSGEGKSKKTEQIYIGQGRYVEDDPKKYPDKDSFGTGGWAGGEAGLQKWLEQGDAVRLSYSLAAVGPSPAGMCIFKLGALHLGPRARLSSHSTCAAHARYASVHAVWVHAATAARDGNPSPAQRWHGACTRAA